MTPSRLCSSVCLAWCAALWGCSSDAISQDDEPATPATPADYGLGDGTLDSVTLTEIYRPNLTVPLSATALAFNRMVEGELWVTLRQFPSGALCVDPEEVQVDEATNDRACAALPGLASVIADATGGSNGVVKEDGNSWHFMRRPSSIAWGEGALFATCGESYTDNYEHIDVPYAGPVLWSSDPTIFGAKPGIGQNGTHLDMLHESPYCMGIAHEAGNAYWVFNGDAGSLDRYDFHVPHQIGGEDHADGEVFRYARGQFVRLPEVPSHLVWDAKRSLLYVVDSGNARLVSLDPKTATAGGDITVYEELSGSGEMLGATVTELVPPGTFSAPSGLALAGDVLYVTDNTNSRIYAFNPEGALLQSLDTALPEGTLGGIALGPDKKLYFTDLLTGAVRRIDPKTP